MAVVGVLGELILTAGVLVLLFVVWQIGWTGLVVGREQAAAAAALEQQFAAAAGPSLPTGPETVSTPLPDGTVFGLLRVPRFGADWVRPIYEGVDPGTLAKGIGHYPGTQWPGQVGNFAIAGHRTTHGNPLLDIDTLQPGDVIVVETQDSYAVYRVAAATVVLPTAVQVLSPVPNQPGATPTEAWLTMTSCHPKFSAAQRFVVSARLDRVAPRAAGLPADLLRPPA